MIPWNVYHTLSPKERLYVLQNLSAPSTLLRHELIARLNEEASKPTRCVVITDLVSFTKNKYNQTSLKTLIATLLVTRPADKLTKEEKHLFFRCYEHWSRDERLQVVETLDLQQLEHLLSIAENLCATDKKSKFTMIVEELTEELQHRENPELSEKVIKKYLIQLEHSQHQMERYIRKTHNTATDSEEFKALHKKYLLHKKLYHRTWLTLKKIDAQLVQKLESCGATQPKNGLINDPLTHSEPNNSSGHNALGSKVTRTIDSTTQKMVSDMIVKSDLQDTFRIA